MNTTINILTLLPFIWLVIVLIHGLYIMIPTITDVKEIYIQGPPVEGKNVRIHNLLPGRKIMTPLEELVDLQKQQFDLMNLELTTSIDRMFLENTKREVRRKMHVLLDNYPELFGKKVEHIEVKFVIVPETKSPRSY